MGNRKITYPSAKKHRQKINKCFLMLNRHTASATEKVEMAHNLCQKSIETKVVSEV